VNTEKLSTIVILPIQRAAAAVDDALRDEMLAEVDNDKIQPDSNKPHSESDDEDSVDTDASNESGNGDEFDFSALEGTAKVGIDEQMIARTFHKLEQAALKLVQLSIYLKATQIQKQQDTW
jgi:DNA-directed RNA polymerase delta subunit